MTDGWGNLERRIIECRSCPRLVAHREEIARVRRRQFAEWDYWGRPITGFGDRNARLLIVGLAPAAHGANRTGRVFTGDRSGDWLYEALHATGFANQAASVSRDDGLVLHDAYVTAAARCAPPANKPTAEEFAACRPFLRQELQLLSNVRVVLALGQIALDELLRTWTELGQSGPGPKPKFGHAAEYRIGPGTTLLCSYHPSQQNTFTGRLTRPMFHGVFLRAAELIGMDLRA